jgi:hypothetical protein
MGGISRQELPASTSSFSTLGPRRVIAPRWSQLQVKAQTQFSLVSSRKIQTPFTAKHGISQDEFYKAV